MKCLLDLTQHQPGNLLGIFWERLIFCQIKECVSGIPYLYYEGNEDKLGSLSVTGFETKMVQDASLAKIIKENKAPNMVIYCPRANSFDFVIFDSDSKSHGLQVSVQTTVTKCEKSKGHFYEDKNCDYKYVLTPEKKDVNHIHGHKNTKCAFVEHGLRIVMTQKFLSEYEELLSMFQKK